MPYTHEPYRMRQVAAMVISLLLIAAGTFAVPVSVSGGSTAKRAGCCSDDCRCCVRQSGAPATAPIQATAPVVVQQLVTLPTTAAANVWFAPPPHLMSPIRIAFLYAAMQPLFQRNCTWQI